MPVFVVKPLSIPNKGKVHREETQKSIENSDSHAFRVEGNVSLGEVLIVKSSARFISHFLVVRSA